MADKLDGEIVFTGVLQRCWGATSAGLVRSTTMLVICGAPRFSKKKIETARVFGIPICTEDEFLQKLDGIDLGDLVK